MNVSDDNRVFLLELLSFLEEDITYYQDVLRFDRSLTPSRRQVLVIELSTLAADYEHVAHELQLDSSN
jgi:hypothetical protein